MLQILQSTTIYGTIILSYILLQFMINVPSSSHDAPQEKPQPIEIRACDEKTLDGINAYGHVSWEGIVYEKVPIGSWLKGNYSFPDTVYLPWDTALQEVLFAEVQDNDSKTYVLVPYEREKDVPKTARIASTVQRAVTCILAAIAVATGVVKVFWPDRSSSEPHVTHVDLWSKTYGDLVIIQTDGKSVREIIREYIESQFTPFEQSLPDAQMKIDNLVKIFYALNQLTPQGESITWEVLIPWRPPDIWSSQEDARNETSTYEFSIKHTVSKGDTIYRICHDRGILHLINEVIAYNKVDPTNISPWSVLYLPDVWASQKDDGYDVPGVSIEWWLEMAELTQLLRNALNKPRSTARSKLRNYQQKLGKHVTIEPDTRRLSYIAHQMWLWWRESDKCSYGGFCAANTRAMMTSILGHLEQRWIELPFKWGNISTWYKVGAYFQKSPHPWIHTKTGFKKEVDAQKMVELISGMPWDFFIVSYAGQDQKKHSAWHVHIAVRTDKGIVFIDPSWKDKTGKPSTELSGHPRFHDPLKYIDLFVNSPKNEWDPRSWRYYIDTVVSFTNTPRYTVEDYRKLIDNSKWVQMPRWADLTKIFEANENPKNLYVQKDAKGDTRVIGYGTDLGMYTGKGVPPFSFADDVHGVLSKHYTADELQSIYAWEKSITWEIADELFRLRYDKRVKKLADAYKEFAWTEFWSLPIEIQTLLADMSYNLRWDVYGVIPKEGSWFAGFPNMLRAIKDKDYTAVANGLSVNGTGDGLSLYAETVWPRRAGYHVLQIMSLAYREGWNMQKLNPFAGELAFVYDKRFRPEFVQIASN